VSDKEERKTVHSERKERGPRGPEGGVNADSQYNKRANGSYWGPATWKKKKREKKKKKGCPKGGERRKNGGSSIDLKKKRTIWWTKGGLEEKGLKRRNHGPLNAGGEGEKERRGPIRWKL